MREGQGYFTVVRLSRQAWRKVLKFRGYGIGVPIRVWEQTPTLKRSPLFKVVRLKQLDLTFGPSMFLLFVFVSRLWWEQRSWQRVTAFQSFPLAGMRNILAVFIIQSFKTFVTGHIMHGRFSSRLVRSSVSGLDCVPCAKLRPKYSSNVPVSVRVYNYVSRYW